MPHPVTQPEILAALESNASSFAEFFSSVDEAILFDGDPDHWSPAHHLVHVTRASASVTRALRSGSLALHSTGRSRAYAEVREAAAASVAATASDRLLEMGRTVVIGPDTTRADLMDAFAAASAELRSAASPWTEETLDRHALRHPLAGEMTVREILFFTVFHERHHLKIARTRQ